MYMYAFNMAGYEMVHLTRFHLLYVSAAVRRNPLARKITHTTFQLTAAKWLYGARDREGGHRNRVNAAQSRKQARNQ